MHLAVARPFLHQPLETLALHGGVGRHDADMARQGQRCGRLDGGLDADDGQSRVGFADGMHCLCCGGIAGHHQQLDGVGIDQVARDGQAALLDLFRAAFAVGRPGRVCQIDEILLRQQAQQLAQHAQPAHATVENANGTGGKCGIGLHGLSVWAGGANTSLRDGSMMPEMEAGQAQAGGRRRQKSRRMDACRKSGEDFHARLMLAAWRWELPRATPFRSLRQP